MMDDWSSECIIYVRTTFYESLLACSLHLAITKRTLSVWARKCTMHNFLEYYSKTLVR